MALVDKIVIFVIFEGVETKQQVEVLKKEGAQYVQGFYFSRPLRAEEFKAYCAAHR